MQELLLSDEFRLYRKCLIEMLVNHFDLFTATNLAETKGALELARKVIRLPEKLVKNKQPKKLIQAHLDEDIKDFQVRFVRKHIVDE